MIFFRNFKLFQCKFPISGIKFRTFSDPDLMPFVIGQLFNLKPLIGRFTEHKAGHSTSTNRLPPTQPETLLRNQLWESVVCALPGWWLASLNVWSYLGISIMAGWECYTFRL